MTWRSADAGVTAGFTRFGAFKDYYWVATAATLYLYIFVRVQWRVGDEGDILNGALAVSEGRVPYRDFFDIRGPGAFYWLGLFFKIFGPTWFVARVHLLLTGAMTSLLVYHLTRRVCRTREVVLPCALVTTLSLPLWPASHHHWDSNLFALAAASAHFRMAGSWQVPRLFAAGLLAGLSRASSIRRVSPCSCHSCGDGDRAAELPRLRSGWWAVPVRLGGYGTVGMAVLAWFFHIVAFRTSSTPPLVPAQHY